MFNFLHFSGIDLDKENSTFLELGLVPSAVLNFKWDASTLEVFFV